jgi:hypothetical protein
MFEKPSQQNKVFGQCAVDNCPNEGFQMVKVEAFDHIYWLCWPHRRTALEDNLLRNGFENPHRHLGPRAVKLWEK